MRKHYQILNYFSVLSGIEVQAEQLKRWKRVLKKKVYENLVQFATKENHLARSGYDITRGQDLDTFIANYHLNLHSK